MKCRSLLSAGIFSLGTFLAVLPLHAETELEKALGTIRKSKSVDDSAVGFGGVTTDTYLAFKVLKDGASREELLKLANDPHVNIRAYAALALGERFPGESFSGLLRDKLKDDATFNFWSGCSRETYMIGDFYFETFSPNLTDPQRFEIAELLLQPTKLHSRNFMLAEWDLPERFLPEILSLVESGEDGALIALGRFKRPQDMPIIAGKTATNPFEMFRCVQMNPQPFYLAELGKIHPVLLAEEHHSGEQRQFYLALAAFGNASVLPMFTRVLDGGEQEIPMRKYHLDFIFEAISAHPFPVFDDLKWRFWDELNKIDLTNYNHLLTLDGKRATLLTRKTLGQLDWTISDELLAAMFSRMGKIDPALVTGTVTRELAKGEVSRYRFFTGIAERTKDKHYVEPLIHNMETHSNPHVYLAATKALLAYKDREITDRVIAAPAKNPNLSKDWGGKAFKKMTEAIAR